MPDHSPLVKLNLGCGAHVPKGWINVDCAFGARVAKLPLISYVSERKRLLNTRWSSTIFIHDLRKRFPWSDGSIDIIYTSHTLEHFSREGGKRFLAECHRVLQTNGLIRIVVPDLAVIVRRYVTGSIKADAFLDELGTAYRRDRDNFIKRVLAPYVRFPHRCMYDLPTLLATLRDMGFEATEKAPFESQIVDIKAVELTERTVDSVIVEGRQR
jgi:predicted SAM-dependent methyltransferase